MRYLQTWLFPLAVILSGCAAEEESDRSKTYVTFYPPAIAFDAECAGYSDAETCTFTREVRFDGSAPQTITIKSRKDGELAADGNGDYVAINATYSVTFSNSVVVDLFKNGSAIFDPVIYSSEANQHLCIPISELKSWKPRSALPLRQPENSQEALEFVEACTAQNRGEEVSDTEAE